MPVAIVIDRNHAFLAHDGRVSRRLVSDPGTIENLAAMLDRAALAFGPARTGTLLVSAPDILTTYRAQLAGREVIARQGATVPGAERWRMVGMSLSAWTTFTRTAGTGRVTVHVGSLPDIDPDRSSLFPPGDDLARIAWRCGWYHAHIGAPWHMTAGVSGCASIRAMFRSRTRGCQPYWGVGSRRPLGDQRGPAGDIYWERNPSKAEAQLGYVIAFDLNAARLAAANVADLPWDSLRQTGPCMFDGDLAGYWLVRRIDLPRTTRLAPPLIPDGDDPHIWLTTPIMLELCRNGHNPEVLDSYTANAKRWLFAWSKRIADARLKAMGTEDPYILRAVKDTYKMTVGMIDREGGSIFNPIVSHTILDRQRVTVITHIKRVHKKTGRWPVKVTTDCLYYASDSSDAQLVAEFLGLSMPKESLLGQFKHYRTIPMAEWLNGRRR